MKTTTFKRRTSSPRDILKNSADLWDAAFVEKVVQSGREGPAFVQGARTLEIFPGRGIQLNAGMTSRKPARLVRGDRAPITKFSASSRRGLRVFLLTHEPLDGFSLWSLTLTIAGPCESPEAKRIFDSYCHNDLERHGCGLIWRVEIQGRGVLHWHCILATPPNSPPNYPETTDCPGLWVLHCATKWAAAVDRLGELVNWPVGASGWLYSGTRSALGMEYQKGRGKKSKRPMFDMEEYREQGAGWMRYLHDHTSKKMGEQEAEGIGRHWGVAGRKKWRKMNSAKLLEFPNEKAYFRYVRALRRLACPMMTRKPRMRDRKGNLIHGRNLENWWTKHAGKFRSSLGFRTWRGSRGRSQWFGETAFKTRLYDWAVRS